MIDRHLFDASARHVAVDCWECQALGLNGDTFAELRALIFATLDKVRPA